MKKSNISKKTSSALGEVIGVNRNGIKILKPTPADIRRNLAKSRQMIEEADSYSDVRGGIRG